MIIIICYCCCIIFDKQRYIVTYCSYGPFPRYTDLAIARRDLESSQMGAAWEHFSKCRPLSKPRGVHPWALGGLKRGLFRPAFTCLS